MEPNVTQREVLQSLAAEARALTEADHERRLSLVRYDLAKHRFAAVRDLAQRYLRGSPYSKEMRGLWPDAAVQGEQFRFVGMAPGEAAVAALTEANPVTASELTERLASGGLQLPLRVLTAALTRHSAIGRDEDEKYFLKEADPDDLPFE